MKILNYLLTMFISIFLLGCELQKEDQTNSIEADDYVIVKHLGGMIEVLDLLHSRDKEIDYQLAYTCDLSRWRGVVPVQRVGSTIVNLNNNDACYVTKVLSIVKENYETTLLLSGEKYPFGPSVLGDNKIQIYFTPGLYFERNSKVKLQWFGTYGDVTDINNTKRRVLNVYKVLEMY